MEYYNGKSQSMRRLYNSLRNFVGENAIYPAGDVLCVSVRNNDEYKLFLHADGKSRFLDLYRKATDGDGGNAYPKVVEEADGTLRIIVKE